MAKPSVEDPCATAGEALVEIWGPAQRNRIEARDAGLGAEHLLTMLDLRTENLATTRTQLCASELRHADAPDSAEARFDAQQGACLDHAQRHLERLVDELVSPEFTGRYADFIEAVDLLPSCTRRRTLERWEPGGDGEQLDALLAQALTEHARGDYAEAAKLAREVAARSEDNAPLRHVHALYRLGRALGLERRDGEAHRTLEHARNQAFALGHDELMCRASAFQAKLDAGLSYEPAAAKRELDFAQACALRVGAGSVLLQAELLEARGLLALAANEGAQAARWHREALALRSEQLGPRHPEVASSKLNLANALAVSDEEPKSSAIRELYLEALELREALYGQDHPIVAHVLHDLGDFERTSGDAKRAQELLERAELIFDQADDRYARGRLRVHIGLAALALDARDYARARVQLERGQSVETGPQDLRHEHAALAQLDGLLSLSEGDAAGAAHALRRATRLYDQLEPNSEHARECMAFEIEASYALEDYARIVVLAREGGAPLRARMAAFSPDVRGALAWYAGDALMRKGDRDLAQIYLLIAERSYAELGDEPNTRELQALLSTLSNAPSDP